MQLKSLFFTLIVCNICFNIDAKVTTVDSIAENPSKAGGVYLKYPISEDSEILYSRPPKGYKPFYISHYGRHGSRYLINDDDYKHALDWLREAYYYDNLTERGKKLKEQLDTIWEEAHGRGGELSPLGNRQHRNIAHRMIKNNPEVFAGSPEITAKSTVIMRCAHSMFSFIEGLKDINPSLDIPRESGSRAMDYLNYHSPESNKHSGHKGEWYPQWRNFRNIKTNPERLIKVIFKDIETAQATIDLKEAMWDLYWIAIDLQNMETSIRLYDIFTPQELFDLWQVFNFNLFACNSSYPAAQGTITDNAKNLLRNIIETADEYIAENKNGATLRFGHDGNIIPLTALMRLNDCYAYVSNPYDLSAHWADYNICPMAANLQMIFYRSDKNPDILVKIMLNERDISIDGIHTDTFPFYNWKELRQGLQLLLDTPSKAYLPVEWIESDDLEEWLKVEDSRFK